MRLINIETHTYANSKHTKVLRFVPLEDWCPVVWDGMKPSAVGGVITETLILYSMPYVYPIFSVPPSSVTKTMHNIETAR